MAYGNGSLSSKMLCWFFLTIVAAISIEVAALVGAGAGIALFLALTVGGALLGGWLIVRYGALPAAARKRR